MMRCFFIISLLISLTIDAQTYGVKQIIADYGTFKREISTTNEINISSYVTKQNILTYDDYEQKQKTVSDLPKYRYELILTSNSTYNNILTKTWIYNARIFINNIEITNQQFPNRFTAIIETKPTVIYWFETSLDDVNIEITWENSMYYKKKN